MTIVKNQYGGDVDFDAAMQIADEDLIEDLHREGYPDEIPHAKGETPEQIFFIAYCHEHLNRYHEEFEPNKTSGQW